MSEGRVAFPEGHRPEESRIYTFNELRTEAPIDKVWACLIRAARWPAWYSNCKKLAFEPGEGPDLSAGMLFHWTTFGVRVHTTVTELVPGERLSWRGVAPGSSGYHGWVLEPTASGCRIVTEETQRGLIPTLGRWYLRPALLRAHQRWLEGLAAEAAQMPS